MITQRRSRKNVSGRNGWWSSAVGHRMKSFSGNSNRYATGLALCGRRRYLCSASGASPEVIMARLQELATAL